MSTALTAVIILILVVIASILLVGCLKTTYTHTILNFRQVNEHLWRGGQPTTDDGWRFLKSLGIQRVIKLNYPAEGTDAGGTQVGLRVIQLSIQPEGDQDVMDDVLGTFKLPDEATVKDALMTLMTDDIPTYVHCTHGEDRTGLIVAMYRVFHDHWSKEKALEEAIKNGFHPELMGLMTFWLKNVKETH